MLVQRAAAGDVEDLHAAADREDRQPVGVGGACQRQLELVKVCLDRAGALVAALAVGLGIQVGPAGQADAVDPGQQRLSQLGRQRRRHDRDCARGLERLQVAQPERHLALRRLALRGRLDRVRLAHLGGGDSDQWPCV